MAPIEQALIRAGGVEGWRLEETGVKFLCGYDSEDLWGPLRGGGGNVCPLSFKTCHFTHIEEEAMSLSVFHYCIWAFLCHCHSLSPSLYHLLLFLLSYVAVSRPWHLSEFDPNMASFINSNESFFLHVCVLCPPFFFKVVLLCLFELLFCGNRPRNG